MQKQFYISKEQYNIVKSTWKTSHHSAPYHIIYNILRSKKPTNGFNAKTKNIQGNDPWFGYHSALRVAKNYCHPIYNLSFKHIFGIDIPENIKEKLEEIK